MRRIRSILGLTCLATGLLGASSHAQTIGPETLRSMPPGSLQALYQGASVPAGLPAGSFKGIPLVATGTAVGPVASRAARAVWQGKIVRPDGGTAVNRFFGLPLIEGRLYQGTSWLDGQPALILDYQGTSRAWDRYRDEIRQVGPDLYLGTMYARERDGSVSPVRWFAFQAR